MFKTAARIATGPSLGRALPKTNAARRFISTAPPHQKSRSWRSSAARWGLAGALVYYYNTASVFAEEPAYAVHAPPETSRERETFPTIDSVSEQRRAQARSRPSPPANQAHPDTVAAAPDAEAAAPGSPEALEEEASEQGAFNEETGEINWDCPCLGGMAYGPCGEQFRAAFSCFVFSQEEPKGVDCIEHFKTMQNCFREHPDIYGSELDDDEPSAEGQEGEAAIEAGKPADDGTAKSAESAAVRGAQAEASNQLAAASSPSAPTASESTPTEPLPSPPSSTKVDQATNAEKSEDEAVPKAWHDSR